MFLDKPLTEIEQDNKIAILEGCKNRLCVTDDIAELFTLLYSATNCLIILAESRYLELKERAEDESTN